ncbi:hypothetical protein Bca4012_025989 [Brassica carinata]
MRVRIGFNSLDLGFRLLAYRCDLSFVLSPTYDLEFLVANFDFVKWEIEPFCLLRVFNIVGVLVRKAVKQCLPGPYTFILTASKELPKQCVGYGTTNVKYASRKNVGVRISDDAVCQAILQAIDAPLICTSVKGPKENEWMIDPTAIGDIYGPEGLDFVVDGGVRVAEPSTIVDMTGPYPKLIREGKGPILPWMEVEDDDESRLRQDLVASGT